MYHFAPIVPSPPYAVVIAGGITLARGRWAQRHSRIIGMAASICVIPSCSYVGSKAACFVAADMSGFLPHFSLCFSFVYFHLYVTLLCDCMMVYCHICTVCT